MLGAALECSNEPVCTVHALLSRYRAWLQRTVKPASSSADMILSRRMLLRGAHRTRCLPRRDICIKRRAVQSMFVAVLVPKFRPKSLGARAGHLHTAQHYTKVLTWSERLGCWILAMSVLFRGCHAAVHGAYSFVAKSGHAT